MKASGFLIALSASSLATALSFPRALLILPKRDVTTLVDDVNTISADAQEVYSDIEAFQGGADGTDAAVAIEEAANTLNTAILNATADAEASAVLDDTDSATVANAVTGLQTIVFDLLDALTAKKELFSTASLGFDAIPIVESSLASQRENTLNYGGNVTAKLSPTLQKLAPLITYNIDFHLVRAVQAFSTG